jgi:hypothetical protein
MLHHHDEDSWLLWLCVAAKSSQCSCQQSVNVLKPLVKLQKVRWYCAGLPQERRTKAILIGIIAATAARFESISVQEPIPVSRVVLLPKDGMPLQVTMRDRVGH